VNLNLAQLVFVNSAAAVLAGLVPVPGGIGAAEASPPAGLISHGVSMNRPRSRLQSLSDSGHSICRRSGGYASLQWLTLKGYI